MKLKDVKANRGNVKEDKLNPGSVKATATEEVNRPRMQLETSTTTR